jgi:hypothetical protein
MNAPREVVEVVRQWVRKAEHDLEELAALLPPGRALSVPLSELVGMAPYAVDVRYANDWREPRMEDARRSLDLAERVRGEVRPSLPAGALE